MESVVKRHVQKWLRLVLAAVGSIFPGNGLQGYGLSRLMRNRVANFFKCAVKGINTGNIKVV